MTAQPELGVGSDGRGRSATAAVSGTRAATGPSQGVAGDGVRVLVLDDSTSDAEPTAGNRPDEGGVSAGHPTSAARTDPWDGRRA